MNERADRGMDGESGNISKTVVLETVPFSRWTTITMTCNFDGESFDCRLCVDSFPNVVVALVIVVNRVQPICVCPI